MRKKESETKAVKLALTLAKMMSTKKEKLELGKKLKLQFNLATKQEYLSKAL